MPRRALIERRPWLLASIAIAAAGMWLHDPRTPGVYLMGLRAAPLCLLGVYALLRHQGRDTRMLAGMLVLEGAGSALALVFPLLGLNVLLFANLVGLALFLAHRRLQPDIPHRVGAGALVLLVPAICYYAATRAGTGAPLFFGLSLGGMAAAAWVSTFPQGRVGAGAVLIVFGSVLGLADSAGLAALAGWALFYLGNLVLATGVTGELRLREEFG